MATDNRTIYQGMIKEQLRELAGKRGLPVSGTNEELIERLATWDEEADPLLDESLVQSGEQLPEPADNNNVEVNPRMPIVAFETTFPCPGELSTGVHLEYLERTHRRAVEAGHRPRGQGAMAAARTGWRMVNGERHAVYSIPVSKG